MSDEETDDDDRQTWRVSQSGWRATRLNEILQKHQQKLTEQQNSSCRIVHWRVASDVVNKRPPPGGVQALYLKDNYSSKLLLLLFEEHVGKLESISQKGIRKLVVSVNG